MSLLMKSDHFSLSVSSYLNFFFQILMLHNTFFKVLQFILPSGKYFRPDHCVKYTRQQRNNLSSSLLLQVNVPKLPICSICLMLPNKDKGKKSRNRPGVAQRVPGGFRLPDFHDIRHMKTVGLSASRTGRIYPQEVFLVLIFTRV